MTDGEKNVLIKMAKMIAELAYLNGVYEAVLKRNVKDWKEQIEVANASPGFQALRREIESKQRSIEKTN